MSQQVFCRQRAGDVRLSQQIQKRLSKQHRSCLNLFVAFEQIVQIAKLPARIAIDQHHLRFIIDHLQAQIADVVVVTQFARMSVSHQAIFEASGEI